MGIRRRIPLGSEILEPRVLLAAHADIAIRVAQVDISAELNHEQEVAAVTQNYATAVIAKLAPRVPQMEPVAATINEREPQPTPQFRRLAPAIVRPQLAGATETDQLRPAQEADKQLRLRPVLLRPTTRPVGAADSLKADQRPLEKRVKGADADPAEPIGEPQATRPEVPCQDLDAQHSGPLDAAPAASTAVDVSGRATRPRTQSRVPAQQEPLPTADCHSAVHAQRESEGSPPVHRSEPRSDQLRPVALSPATSQRAEATRQTKSLEQSQTGPVTQQSVALPAVPGALLTMSLGRPLSRHDLGGEPVSPTAGLSGNPSSSHRTVRRRRRGERRSTVDQEEMVHERPQAGPATPIGRPAETPAEVEADERGTVVDLALLQWTSSSHRVLPRIAARSAQGAEATEERVARLWGSRWTVRTAAGLLAAGALQKLASDQVHRKQSLGLQAPLCSGTTVVRAR